MMGEVSHGPDTATLLARAILPLDDLGNAERIRSQAAGRLLWVESEGRWAAHDGRRYSLEMGQHEAESLAQAVAKCLRDEAFALMSATEDDVAALGKRWADAELRKLHAKDLLVWASKTSMADRCGAMLRQARRAQGMFVADLDAFDVDPLKLNVENGIIKFVQVDAKRWEFRFRPGHEPADMMMQIAGVAYDPEATAPHWLARMALIQPDEAVQSAMQRTYGSSLTGLTSSQTFNIHRGSGNDGKSMTHKIIVALLKRYARHGNADTFLEGPQKSGSDHRSDLIALLGDVRFIVTDEPQGKSPVWNSQVIKQFTGSVVTARGAYAKDDKTYIVKGKLHIEANVIPRARSDDHGMVRRTVIIPYARQFGITDGMVDEDGTVVEARLKAELPGILNWMIEGALAWLPQPKFPMPAPMRVAAANYWQGDNPMADWFRQCCDVADPAAGSWASDLYASYAAWYHSEGHKDDEIKDKVALGRWLKKSRNLDKRKSNGNNLYVGVRLRDAAEILAREKEEGQVSLNNTPPPPASQEWGDDDDLLPV